MARKNKSQVTKTDNKYSRKRTPTEVARDRALIAELHYKGHNDTEITDILNSRAGVQYEISRRQTTYDRNQMLKQWQKRQEDSTELWIAEAMMQLSAVQREAWNAWEETLKPREKEQTEEVFDEELGEMRLDKVKRYIVQGLGDKAYLDTIINCIKEKNRLRGLHQVRLQVDQRVRSETVIKTYHSFSPDMWDDNRLNVVEGEIIKQALSDGND